MPSQSAEESRCAFPTPEFSLYQIDRNLPLNTDLRRRERQITAKIFLWLSFDGTSDFENQEIRRHACAKFIEFAKAPNYPLTWFKLA